VFAHHSYAVPSYPYFCADYASVTAVFVHHINIASLLITGGSAHIAISVLRDLAVTSSFRATITTTTTTAAAVPAVAFDLLAHRCLITGHLAFLNSFLGLHAFGILVHNDTLQGLARQSDLFSDNALQLKPVLALWLQSTRTVAYDIDALGSRVISMTQELGTADFIVHH
jgi:photosystem I P700 chlorophyll a apoprotein A1